MAIKDSEIRHGEYPVVKKTRTRVNFRLSDKAISELSKLAIDTWQTKTAVVEQLIRNHKTSDKLDEVIKKLDKLIKKQN